LSEWGTQHVALSFAFKGGQYLSYEFPQPISIWITQDATPSNVNALLMFISQWTYPQ
jgi:hypothetical protein